MKKNNINNQKENATAKIKTFFAILAKMEWYSFILFGPSLVMLGVVANCIYLKNHIEARSDEKIKEKEDTIFDNNKYQAKIIMTANNFNCLIEGRDFEMTPMGEIKFYD